MSSELDVRHAHLTQKVGRLEELLVERRELVAARQAELARITEAVAKACAALLREQRRQASLKAKYATAEARAWNRVKG